MKFSKLHVGALFVFGQYNPQPDGTFPATMIREKCYNDGYRVLNSSHAHQFVNDIDVTRVVFDTEVDGWVKYDPEKAAQEIPALADNPKHFIGNKPLDTDEQHLIDRVAVGTKEAYVWVKTLKVGDIFRGLAGEADKRFAKNSVEFHAFLAGAAVFSEGLRITLDERGFVIELGQDTVAPAHVQD